MELTTADGYPVLPDLADPGLRLSIQYDGAHHDSQQQRERDIRRHRATEAAGWREVRVIGADLKNMAMMRGQWVPRAVALVMAAVRGHESRTRHTRGSSAGC